MKTFLSRVEGIFILVKRNKWAAMIAAAIVILGVFFCVHLGRAHSNGARKAAKIAEAYVAKLYPGGHSIYWGIFDRILGSSTVVPLEDGSFFVRVTYDRRIIGGDVFVYVGKDGNVLKVSPGK